MKNISCILSMCLLVVLATGCKKDKPALPPPPYPILIAQIEGVPDEVTFDRIEAEITGFEWEVIGKAEGVYENGEATLLLPAGFAGERLCKVIREDGSDYTGFWRADTDTPEARVAGLGDILAYDGDVKVGRIYQAARPATFIYYHYADRPFELSGSYGGFRYEAVFQRGWNAYAKVSQSQSANLVTTEIPAEGLTWYFEKH